MSTYPQKEQFAILRHERIRRWTGPLRDRRKGSNSVSRWRHMLRLQDTDNADPDRLNHNLIVSVDTGMIPKPFDWVPPGRKNGPWRNQHYLRQEGLRLIRELGIQSIRSDATVLEEVLMSASPEWFRDGDILNEWNQQRVRQFVDACIAYILERYPRIVCAIVVHLDESTPHVSAFILPAIRHLIIKRGLLKKGIREVDRPATIGYKMCAWKLFSSSSCKKNQTAFAKFIQARGIKVRRGIEGSRSSYVTMALQRKLLNTPTPEPPHIEPPTEEQTKPHLKPGQTHGEYVGEYLANKYHEYALKLHAKGVAFDQTLRKQNEYQATASDMQIALEDLKQQTAPVTPHEALSKLGLAHGSKNHQYESFHTPTGKTIVVDIVTGSFQAGWSGYTLKPECNSNDTLIAIRIATGQSTDWAGIWLGQHFGPNRAAATIAMFPKPNKDQHDPFIGASVVPKKAIENWQDYWPWARQHIVEKYGLPITYLNEKLSKGTIGVNEFGAVLFEKRDHVGKPLSPVIATDVPGYVYQFDPFPEQSGFFMVGNPASKNLFITDTPLLALALEYLLVELGKVDFQCVSLLESSDSEELRKMMEEAGEVHLVLRSRFKPIPGHEKLVGIPEHAIITNLGSPTSLADYFYKLLRDSLDGSQLLDSLRRDIFGGGDEPPMGLPHDDPKI